MISQFFSPKVAPYSSINSTNIKRDHTFNIENTWPLSTESQRQSKQPYVIFNCILFLGFLILSIMAEFFNQPIFSWCHQCIYHSHSKILRCLWKIIWSRNNWFSEEYTNLIFKFQTEEKKIKGTRKSWQHNLSDDVLTSTGTCCTLPH